MKYQIVVLDNEDELELIPGDTVEIGVYCKEKILAKDSQCKSFYLYNFSHAKVDDRFVVKCPYGFNCIGPIKWTERVRVVSGLLFEDDGLPVGMGEVNCATTKERVERFLHSFDQIADEFHKQNYEYLESAIHDVRHLNGDITTHSERLLKNLGYAENVDWDKAKLNSQEVDRRTLSIYCASRDISAALSMHEIAMDPSRAENEIVPTNIHKLFFRQKQINQEKIERKKLNIQLENTTVSKNLTRSFSLVPIVVLNNAIKYAEVGTTINIKFAEVGGVFRITCSNTGPIVRQDELKAVFLKNRRGSNRTGIPGHGIGLWLASVILNANMGTIEMEAEETGRDIAARKTGKTSVIIRLS